MATGLKKQKTKQFWHHLIISSAANLLSVRLIKQLNLHNMSVTAGGKKRKKNPNNRQCSCLVVLSWAGSHDVNVPPRPTETLRSRSPISRQTSVALRPCHQRLKPGRSCFWASAEYQLKGNAHQLSCDKCVMDLRLAFFFFFKWENKAVHVCICDEREKKITKLALRDEEFLKLWNGNGPF